MVAIPEAMGYAAFDGTFENRARRPQDPLHHRYFRQAVMIGAGTAGGTGPLHM
jgi:hypothetical protein